MTDTTLVDLESTVDAHLAGYCEPDPDRRLELLRAAWARTVGWSTRRSTAPAPTGIAELVDAVLGHYPDHTFRRTTAVDAHHDLARYGWELVAPGRHRRGRRDRLRHPRRPTAASPTIVGLLRRPARRSALTPAHRPAVSEMSCSARSEAGGRGQDSPGAGWEVRPTGHGRGRRAACRRRRSGRWPCSWCSRAVLVCHRRVRRRRGGRRAARATGGPGRGAR